MTSDAAVALITTGMRPVIGRELTDDEASSFCKYLKLLISWQSSHRLVGSDDPAWIVRNVFVDSALFLRVLPPEATDVLDIGSGAGVPGLTLKILRPEIHLTMVESRRRRASFLAAAKRDLGLERVNVVNARLEAKDAPPEGAFDVVVGRCAGDPLSVIELGLALVRPGGSVIVAGPPRPFELPRGEWVTVPGPEPGVTRRFAVAQRP
jgi:16S rRNA (guanine527-N7)-methyltransferase